MGSQGHVVFCDCCKRGTPFTTLRLTFPPVSNEDRVCRRQRLELELWDGRPCVAPVVLTLAYYNSPKNLSLLLENLCSLLLLVRIVFPLILDQQSFHGSRFEHSHRYIHATYRLL